MPPNKKKSRDRTTGSKGESLASESSLDLEKETKPKKQKPLTKKEKDKLRKMEKEMKEALIQLRKNADMALAEFKAMEEASEKKAKAELFEHNKRVELLSGTCETFKMGKDRLLHENSKQRDAEIWERYLKTDRKPYPENVPDMRNHLHLWQQSRETEYMEFALSKCDSYVDTLTKLDELIEYPLYSSKATIENWKELRREWRDEFLYKIDKACFNMIKNLSKNFEQERNQSHIFSFEDAEEHVKLGMCAYVEYKTQGSRMSPKIKFPTVNAEIVMPAVYRMNPFILRIVYLDQDFFSETSMTYYCPDSLPMEPDLLKEIHRCFEAKKEAKSLVADREREKVRQAKQKVLEAQAAANVAEKSFHTFQQQSLEPIKKRESKSSLPEKPAEAPQEPKKKKARPDVVVITAGSESSVLGGKKRPRGVMDDRDGESMAKSLMQSTGTKKTLDAISTKSGMRRKQDRMKKMVQSIGTAEPEPSSIFWTHSMLSLSHRAPKLEVRRASELCFEEPDEEMSKLDVSDPDGDDDSYDSLDLMFGRGDDEERPKIKPLKELVRDTVIIDREANRQQRLKSAASISYDGKKGRRRGKSNANPLKGRGLTDDSEEAQQTSSEIFDAAEEIRQEHYMSSLLYPSLPQKRFHINLREYSIIGGTYLLDIIFHESQPHKLRNGNTVQIFYGEMNIKRDDYKYDYQPPPPPGPDDDPEEPVLDPGLQHLLHVKLPLPRDVFILDPPIVALWDQEMKFWTNEHVHKVVVDLESSSASFSIGRVQPFAFFLKKYLLLPFDSWNMKPKLDTGGVMLSLQGFRATLEFHIEGFQVCLSKAETPEGAIFEVSDILGEFMHLHKLIGIMKTRGLNIFPDEDGFLYTQNSCKDVVLEDHTYLSMAMFSDTLEFLSCEMNMEFKRRKLAFRVRECLAYNLELRYRTVITTCLSTQMYRLGLDDTSFDETKTETSYGFCPDVYSLLEKAFAHVSSPSAPNPLQILAVYALLSRTKVFSYSGVIHPEKSVSFSGSSRKSIRKKVKKGTKQRAVKSLKNRSSNQSLTLVASKLSTASDLIQ